MIRISRYTKLILISIAVIVVAAFVTAYIYYSAKNRAEDPRVVEVKKMLAGFDKICTEKGFDFALLKLDSIETVLKNTEAYTDSYELGIVYNNRGSVYLQQALYEITDSAARQSMLEAAAYWIEKSIERYTGWMKKYGALHADSLMIITRKTFSRSDPAFARHNYERVVQKRVDDLLMAQKETPRRISVAYTNQGIIRRHQYRQDEALQCYIQAIKLWKDNVTARNNFNVLMGLPPEDRSIIDQLFPPEKNKFD